MILLDTNAAYWSLVADEKIGIDARTRMSGTECFVSALTVVEFRIKEMKGKLHVPAGLAGHLAALGFRTLSFEPGDADALLDFPTLVKHDPFARMLVAQAKVNGFDFLTADRTLLALDLPWIRDATR